MTPVETFVLHEGLTAPPSTPISIFCGAIFRFLRPKRTSGPVKSVVGCITSTCPTSSDGREYFSVRVIGDAMSVCLKVSNWAAKMALAWDTGKVMDTQSLFGDMTYGLRLFDEAKSLKADMVSWDGCTKDLT